MEVFEAACCPPLVTTAFPEISKDDNNATSDWRGFIAD
jgi:hypothetical protein